MTNDEILDLTVRQFIALGTVTLCRVNDATGIAHRIDVYDHVDVPDPRLYSGVRPVQGRVRLTITDMSFDLPAKRPVVPE